MNVFIPYSFYSFYIYIFNYFFFGYLTVEAEEFTSLSNSDSSIFLLFYFNTVDYFIDTESLLY